ncbi:MAG: YbcC family protein [Gammaproteobacteria bacterium]
MASSTVLEFRKQDATPRGKGRSPDLSAPFDYAVEQGRWTASEALDAKIDAACGRIAPLWPLKHFVAVNPFFGLRDLTFQEASDTLARVSGSKLYMDWAYYRAQIAEGRISRADLEQSIERCGSNLDVSTIEWTVNAKPPRPNLGMASVSEVLDRVDGGIWQSFVTERISLHCAAYFDLGQATHKMPWRDLSLYESWLKAAAVDRSPAMMGLKRFRPRVRLLPAKPRDMIALALDQLDIPEAAMKRYLHASLRDVGGWASWTRYLRWQAELAGGGDDTMVDLLAIKLAWDMLLFDEKRSGSLVARWREMLAASMRPPSAKRQLAAEIDRILLTAAEIAFQRTVIDRLVPGRFSAAGPAESRPAVQAAFCIDVRSEVFRRSLETVGSNVRTLGFAGFFGVPIEYVPLGASKARAHVPVLLNPAYRVGEGLRDETEEVVEDAARERRERLGWAKAWKGFKYSASSCFSFVEATGLMYAPKLISDSFGWTRPVPDPASQGLDSERKARLAPSLEACACPTHAEGGASGIPAGDRVDIAERVLRGMSLTRDFARLVVLAGHGSTSVNNPHATSLDCGACAGQTGEASARVVADLLNLRAVRVGLRERGIHIPGDTWFLAALHDTTTDDMTLFDGEAVPDALGADLAQLRQWLTQAGDLTRMQRAALLGIEDLPDRDIADDVRRRGRDWSQVRPEWALANNAAFIAAPRGRTLDANLGGRAFLHEYQWREDEGFQVLELIMTAPMIVANWINMQYYGSVVDNARFGSGNKVLHNVVGGAIGVLEGNGGDLRVGLPMQSLHDGKRWVHEPLRLSVFIEAPESAIEDVIANHETVAQLVNNRWLNLFRIGDDDRVSRRRPGGGWEPAKA